MGNCWYNRHNISGNISGNTFENNLQLEEIKCNENFIIERLLIYGVYIGIVNNENENENENEYNTKSINNQGIRINEFGNDIRRLIKCSGDDNKLIYNFENNTTLTIYKDNGIIMICLESNYNLILTYFGTYAMKSFKPIGVKELSDDLDKILVYKK